MESRASIVAELDSRGETRIVGLSEAAPLALRWTRDAVFLVSTAQGLLGDDALELHVTVRAGATLRIRSAAAMLAYTSRNARFSVTAEVASGGFLDWEPEPLITTRHCRLSVHSHLTLAGDARLRWTESCLLGRFEEEPGDLATSISVNHDGWPLLRHELTIGSDAPSWDGPAGLGGARAIGYRVVVDPRRTAMTRAGAGWAAMALDTQSVVISALATDHQGLIRNFRCAEESLTAGGQPSEAALARA